MLSPWSARLEARPRVCDPSLSAALLRQKRQAGVAMLTSRIGCPRARRVHSLGAGATDRALAGDVPGLALGTVAWLWLIVVTGATVRLTASGLGCEHWPGCTAGNPFPSKSYHSFIEFGNRIVSALTILATLVGWFGARFTPGVPRWVRRLALATFLGTLAQAPLGAITVYSDLNPLLVMSHFLLALVVLAAGVVVAVEAVSFERGRARCGFRPDQARRAAGSNGASRARLHRHGRDRSRAASGRLGRRAAVASARRGLHARSCDRDLRPALSAFAVYVTRHRARWPLYAEGAGVFFFLLLLQMGVGELQYRTELPWWLVLIHVGLAAACGLARSRSSRLSSGRRSRSRRETSSLDCRDGRRAEDPRSAVVATADSDLRLPRLERRGTGRVARRRLPAARLGR